jgi:hypothetical protein
MSNIEVFFVVFGLVAAPIVAVLLWKRRYDELLIGQAVLVAGFVQLTIKNIAIYPLRFIYPVLISVTPVSYVYAVWGWNALFWFIGMILLRRFLVLELHFSREMATIGAMFPLLNYSTVFYGFWHLDGLNSVVVIVIFYCYFIIRRIDNRRQQFSWSLLLVLAGLVGLLNDYPYPMPLDFDIVGRLTRLALTVSIYGFLAASGARFSWHYVKRTVVFLPIYVVIALIAVDWCRWFVLAFPIWVPLSLWGLKWRLQVEEGKSSSSRYHNQLNISELHAGAD